MTNKVNATEIKGIDSKVVEEIRERINTLTKGNAMADVGTDFKVAYLAYVAAENNVADEQDLTRILEPGTAIKTEKYDQQLAPEGNWAQVMEEKNIECAIQLSKMYSKNELLAYLYRYPREGCGKKVGEFGTPDSISNLALKILDIQENEKVADLCSGVCDFITMAADKNEKASFYGRDINKNYCEISKIRTGLFNDNVEIENGDVLDDLNDKKFDKIFMNYPFGMRLRNLPETDYIQELYERVPEIKKATSADWIYNLLMLDHLEKNGKAVAIMTNGSTLNSIDEKTREYFVKGGYVEAVIALPSNLFESTSIPTTMLVLSHDNEKIRMINAIEQCKKGRRQNTFTVKDVEYIAKLLKEEGEEARTVDIAEIEKNDYVLDPTRYLVKKVEVKNGVEFGKVIKRVTRGASLKAKDLDEMVSKNPTNAQYLMIANIQNGMISKDLPYLKEINPKLDKYCIGNKNLLISKNGSPFKVAVAEIEDEKKILANGNLFIIELDEKQVNPYFLKAFFESEIGEATLNSIVVGAVIPTISVSALKKMIVPLPPIEKQEKIATSYQAKQNEIKELQEKIEKAQEELKKIFEEG